MSVLSARPLRRALAVLASFLVAAAIAGTGPANASSPHYYVSLGDSLAFGYQPNLVAAGDYNPSDYVGYSEDFGASSDLSVANFGCPGETTTSMIQGGCPWTAAGAPLHESYASTNQDNAQLATALNFIANNPTEVDVVSIDIGSNDLLAILSQCGSNTSCIEQGVLAMLGRYAYIIGKVKVALATAGDTNAQLVIFNYYNPLVLRQHKTDSLVQQINSQGIVGLARSMHVSVADAFGAINIGVNSPFQRVSVCAKTWECTRYRNIHPNSTGYAALAMALENAAMPTSG